MPRPPTTKVKSERHAELGRASIADRPRDARGRLLPRSGVPAAPATAPPEPSPNPDDAPPPDPTPARSRARLPWQRA